MAKFEALRTDLRRAETGGGPGRGGATAKGMRTADPDTAWEPKGHVSCERDAWGMTPGTSLRTGPPGEPAALRAPPRHAAGEARLPFVHSLNKDLLSTYYVPWVILGSRG